MLPKFIYFGLFLALILPVSAIFDQLRAKIYMNQLDISSTEECSAYMENWWKYSIDVENKNKRNETISSAKEYYMFTKEAATNVSSFKFWKFRNVDLIRRMRFQKNEGITGLKNDSEEYWKLQSDMLEIYQKAKETVFNGTDIKDILAETEDFDELAKIWTDWRKETGQKFKDDFMRFVNLSNTAAKEDGYMDTGDMWLDSFTVTEKEAKKEGITYVDQDLFRAQIEGLWKEISEKLYKPLHAYVRKKMAEKYTDKVIETDPLPANILGTLMGDDWSSLYKYLKPYPEQPDFDATKKMKEMGWTTIDILRESERFLMSLTLPKMSESFWTKSVFSQNNLDTKALCKPEAVDMCKGSGSDDFRIRMCSEVTESNLIEAHRLMGIIEYYMAYSDKKHIYRQGANPAFVETIGDLITLSVSSPNHLKTIFKTHSALSGNKSEELSQYIAKNSDISENYLEKSVESKQEADIDKEGINFLMKMALEKVPALVFSYVLDTYRYGVFSGAIKSNELNIAWWRMVESLQGLQAPSDHLRGSNFFDAGASYFVPINKPHISKFVSIIQQFQIQERLCKSKMDESSKDWAPLYKCDLRNNEIAGEILKNGLAKGFSKPWPEVLKKMSNIEQLTSYSIIEYFGPLITFLNTKIDPKNLQWNSKIDQAIEVSNQLLEDMDTNITAYVQTMVEATYDYETNITKETEDKSNEASVEFSKMYRYWWGKIQENGDREYVTDPFINRQYQMQKSIGTSILNETRLTELNKNINNMIRSYGRKMCKFGQRCEAETQGYDINRLEVEMATNRDYSQLLYYWEEWRELSGKNMLTDYPNYVEIMNEAAKKNGFKDTSSMWLEPYTTYENDEYTEAHFKEEIEKLWQEILPYYQLLHAYVRNRLLNYKPYGNYLKDDHLLPAHILGNMWAQSWENIYDLVAPYKDIELIDITESLKNSTPEAMFNTAEDFFTSIGLHEMTEPFAEKSMIQQPDDNTQVVCHASATDFYTTGITNDKNLLKNGDFRIKMCTNLNQDDFLTIHHEMGHIEYFMEYSFRLNSIGSNTMPLIYRDGANPGFHEAIGDTIQLSVSTPSHLESISKSDLTYSKKSDQAKLHLNFLMKQALTKVAFLPYAYILDQYRWEIFNGSITPEVYNKKWWAKRIDYQGVCPPIKRFASTQFDAGSKYHVPANVPYIRYFVAHILQFQFHERLCKKAGQIVFWKPWKTLAKCDIYGSKEAGKLLKTLLAKGASIQWQKQLKDFGIASMSSSSIIKYFEPLWEFLRKEIKDKDIKIEWKKSSEVLDDYMNTGGGTTNNNVVIIVGVVLAALVAVVIGAFFVGQKKRKGRENKIVQERPQSSGQNNEGMEMEHQL